MPTTVRKMLALFLCLTMYLGLFPASVFAEEYLEEELLFDSDYVEEYGEEQVLEDLYDDLLIEGENLEYFEPADEWLEEPVSYEEQSETETLIEEQFVIETLIEETAEPKEIGAADEAAKEDTQLEADLLSDADVFNNGEGAGSGGWESLMAAINDPAVTQFTVVDYVSGDDLVVPGGFTLTVEGTLICDTLVVNGTVTVTGEGYIDVYDEAVINGSIFFTREDFVPIKDRPSVFFNGAPTLGQNAVFSVTAPGAAVFMYSATSAQELAAAAEAARTVNTTWTNVNASIAVPDHCSFEIPAGTEITLSDETVLNIDGTSLLRNNGTINLSNARIRIFGCLENNGVVNMAADEGFGAVLIKSDGKYQGSGVLNVYDSDENIEYYFNGFNPGAFVATRIEGGVSFSFDTSGLFAELQAACANNDGYFNLNRVGDFVIEDDLVIPAGMYVEARNDRIIIPDGKTLTVYGEFRTSGVRIEEGGALVVDGGYMDIPSAITINGSLTLRNYADVDTGYGAWRNVDQSAITCLDGSCFYVHFETGNEAEAIDAYSEVVSSGLNNSEIAQACIELRFEFTVDSLTEVLPNTRLRTHAGMYIPAGKTFTVNQGLLGIFDDNLVIDGTLVNNGIIDLVNSTAELCDGGSYIAGEDSIIVRNGEEFTLLTQAERFAAVKQAVASGQNYILLDGLGDVVLSEDLTIPANMTLQLEQGRFVVPSGKVLTVYGCTRIYGLLVENGGKVILDTGENGNPGSQGTMDIRGDINLNTSGSLELRNRAQIDSGMYQWKNLDLDRVTFGDDTVFCGHYDATNMSELRNVYNDILSNRLNEQPHLEPFIEVDFPFEVNDINSTIPNTRLRMHAGMYIPEGKTFTVYHGVLAIFDKNLVIDGTLVNNGIVNLNGPVAVLGANGVYTEGEDARGIFRNGQPFTFKSNAEILAELEQAVANGDHYSLTNYGDFVLPNGLTIDHRFFFECWGTNVILPAGQTLRVKSGARLEMHCLIVEEGAHVIVEDGGQLKVYDFLEGDGLITLGDYVYASFPANYSPDIDYGDDCDIKLKYWPSTLQELYAMKDEAEALQPPFFGDLSIQFDWNITDDITFNNVHLSLDHANTQKNRSITVSNGGRLTLNAGIWIKCADLTVNGGTVVNNSEIELCNDGDGATGALRLSNGGSYEGGGRVVVRDIWGEDDPDSHIVGIEGLSRNDDGDGRYIYINAGAIMDDLRSAISNGWTYYDLRSCGTLTLDENETLVIPEGMRIDAWGTTLVVPESATLNVTGEYSGTGLALYGQLLTGKPSVDWSRPMSSMYIRDYLTLGENAHISVGFQSNLSLPGYVLTDEVLSGMIQKVGTDQWITLNWNAFDAAAVSDALTRAGTLSDGYNCHADIRFNWVVDGEVELPNNLDLFVDAAYNEGCITVPAGAKLINNSYINLNGASVNVAGQLENNGTIYIEYDEYGPLYSGYGSVNVTGSYTGGGELCAPKSGNLDEMITGLDLRHFTTSYDEWEDGSVHLVYADAILNGLRSAIQEANNNPDGYYEYWDLGDSGTIILDDNYTIPQNMKVIAWDTTVVVPEGKTLNVVGEYEGSGMELNGSLVMGRPSVDDEQESRIHISDSLTIGSNAGITVGLRSRLEVPAYAMTDSVIKNQVWRTPHNWIMLIYKPQNANELYTAMSRELPDDYGGHAELRFNWVVDGDRELPDNFSIYVDGRENGAITIPQGAKLTLNSYMSFNPATVITVSGSLVNNGHIDFDEENGTCGQIVFNGGSYGGTGEIGIPYGMLSQALSGSIDLSKFIPGDDLGWGTVYTYADAADRAELLVGSAKLRRGAQTTVSVTLSEGTGAEVMQFVLGYDSDVLRVVSATAGELLSSAPTINKDIPGRITFNVDNSPLTDGGSLLDITFEAIAEATSNEAQIWIITDSEDDRDELIVRRYSDNQSIDIPVNCIDGTISIVDYTLGDINDDGEINVKDAFMIRKYQARMINLTATERDAADVNGDNKVNIDDAGLIRRYAIDVIDSFPAA